MDEGTAVFGFLCGLSLVVGVFIGHLSAHDTFTKQCLRLKNYDYECAYVIKTGNIKMKGYKDE